MDISFNCMVINTNRATLQRFEFSKVHAARTVIQLIQALENPLARWLAHASTSKAHIILSHNPTLIRSAVVDAFASTE